MRTTLELTHFFFCTALCGLRSPTPITLCSWWSGIWMSPTRASTTVTPKIISALLRKSWNYKHARKQYTPCVKLLHLHQTKIVFSWIGSVRHECGQMLRRAKRDLHLHGRVHFVFGHWERHWQECIEDFHKLMRCAAGKASCTHSDTNHWLLHAGESYRWLWSSWLLYPMGSTSALLGLVPRRSRFQHWTLRPHLHETYHFVFPRRQR